MSAMVSQITSPTIVHSTIYSRADQRKHQSSASLALCEGNSPVTGEFPTRWTSNAENVSIWWRHHVVFVFISKMTTPVTNQYICSESLYSEVSSQLPRHAPKSTNIRDECYIVCKFLLGLKCDHFSKQITFLKPQGWRTLWKKLYSWCQLHNYA